MRQSLKRLSHFWNWKSGFFGGLHLRLWHTVLPMKLDSPESDLIFTALGNKTRRRILQRLSENPARSISELAREFGISNTAASNQIKILERAGLVARVQRGKYSQIKLSETDIFLTR